MTSETRNLRKRRWKSSPQGSARVGLDFGPVTPSPKKRRILSKDLAGNPDPDSFNIGSFYGKREKMHFPHSPGRRKAVDKVLRKISNDNSENITLAVKGRRKSLPLQVPDRTSQPSFDFHSSDSAGNDSDCQVRNILKPSNTQQKKAAKKVPLKMNKTPKHQKSVKREVKSTGKISLKQTTNIDDPNKTPELSSSKKFFKSRTPNSSDRVYKKVIIIKKGFEIKYVPQINDSSVKSSATKDKSVKKKKNPPTTKVEKVKATTVKSIDPEGIFFVAEKENGNKTKSDSLQSADISRHQKEASGLIRTESSGSSAFSKSPRISEFVRKNSTDSINCATETLTEKLDGTCDIVEEEPTGSEDLFSTDSRTSCSTPVSMITPSASGSPSSLASSDDTSLVSGPEENPTPKQKLFPIFTGGKSNLSTPSSTSSRLSKLSLCKNKKSPMVSPLLKCMKSKDDKDQMGIDAGQKRFGVTQCDTCSMIYEMANPTDEIMHNKFHQSLLNALKFSGWKKERVVQSFVDTGCRIVMVTADDPKYATKKVEQINRIMGEELGFPEPTLAFRSVFQAFLFISEDKMVEGCCVCEPISQAFPVLSDPKSSQPGELSQRPWYCSDTPVPAAVGVSRIWVYGQARRKGIATRLLDCVRQWSVYGTVIPKNKMAFSDPTPDGKILATKYTGMPNFLVYKFK